MHLALVIFLSLVAFVANAAPVFFCVGDSRTRGEATYNYPLFLGTNFTSINFTNGGNNGWSAANEDGAEDALSRMIISTNYTSLYEIYGYGINDLDQGQTSSQIATNILEHLAAVRAAHPTMKFIGMTVYASGTMDAGEEAYRLALNGWIKNSGAFDYTVDLAADSRLSYPTNTTYFYSGDGLYIHLTAAGYGVVADLIAPVLRNNGLVYSTYYVTKSGSDSAIGSQAAPWLTVQKAATTMLSGDTALISSGDYNEYVQTGAHGSNGLRITFAANPTNTSAALMRQFRVKHTYTTLNGLTFSKSSDSTGASAGNNGMVRVEYPGANNGSDCIVTNCVFRDLPYVITSTARFTTTNVTISDGNFTTAGFTNGSLVFFGADSLNAYTNHGAARTVSSNSADGLTMYFTSPITADAGSNYWAAFVAGQDNSTYKGVYAPIGASVGASNLFVVNCLFSNLLGPAIVFTGNSNTIRGNTITANHGQYAFQIQGANALVESNLVVNNRNIEWFTPLEMNGAEHPLGGDYYDWQCNIAASFNYSNTNVVMRYNWFEDCDNQLTMIEHYAGASGFQIQSNVFVGMMAHGSFSRNNLTVDHNTFYRCAYDIGESTPLGMGGTGGNTMTNPVVRYNLFADGGEHASVANEYPFTLVSSTGESLATNYSVSAETIGFAATPAQTGVLTNSGDPLFVNPRNPRGADGLPFTADDGLRLLPDSVPARLGLGALAAVDTSTARSHFAVQLASPGWKDSTSTNYDLAWSALEPHQRTNTIRPWKTSEAVGAVPATVSFSAVDSIDGTSTNWFGLYAFAWDFGDGSTATTPRPYASHTYTVPGDYLVSLWATNFYGSTTRYTNSYRALTGSGIVYVSTSGNDTTGNGTYALPWRTIQKAATSASGGQTISVASGNYGENVDCTVSAGGNRIRFVGHGARTAGFNLRNADYTVEGFELDASGIGAFGSALYVYPTAHRVHLIGNYLHNFTNIYGISLNTTGGEWPQNGPANCVISNNVFNQIMGPQMVIQGSNCLATANIIRNTMSEGDAFRLWGTAHTISYNYCTNLSAFGGGGHADFVQSFGDNGGMLTNVVIEGNVILGNDVQPCMFEHDSSAPYDFSMPYTNIVFRNNLFIDVQYAANVDVDGTKWFNNTFLHVNSSNATHVFAFGGVKGSAYGTELKNNAFVACGNGTTAGWYQVPGDIPGVTNFTVTADYNYATRTDNTAYAGFSETHGVNGGAPLFAAQANRDFRLSATSPMVGAGVALDFASDVNASPRGATWDIGAYVFSAYNSPTSSPPTYTIGTLTVSGTTTVGSIVATGN